MQADLLQKSKCKGLFGSITAVSPFLQGVCWITWRQRKEANWISQNSLICLLRLVNSLWKPIQGHDLLLSQWNSCKFEVCVSVECHGEKQHLLVCCLRVSLSALGFMSKSALQYSALLRAASGELSTVLEGYFVLFCFVLFFWLTEQEKVCFSFYQKDEKAQQRDLYRWHTGFQQFFPLDH